jgi:low affinity Fe/Cu permease
MITLSQLTEFFGWAVVINISYLLIATMMVILLRGTIISIHSKLFAIEEKDLNTKYFDFLSQYKIMTLVFFVAPYFALKVMG